MIEVESRKAANSADERSCMNMMRWLRGVKQSQRLQSTEGGIRAKDLHCMPVSVRAGQMFTTVIPTHGSFFSGGFFFLAHTYCNFEQKDSKNSDFGKTKYTNWTSSGDGQSMFGTRISLESGCQCFGGGSVDAMHDA
jgi:hypothetical protein